MIAGFSSASVLLLECLDCSFVSQYQENVSAGSFLETFG